MKKFAGVLTVIAGLFISLAAHANHPPLGTTINKYFGEHVPLFVFEKTFNPENIIIIYTKVDRNCRIIYDRQKQQPTFGLYWLDDGVRFDPAPQLANQFLSRMPVEDIKDDPYSFYVRLTDLRQLHHDLADERLLIRSEQYGNSCLVGAYMRLKNKKLVRVTSTLTDAAINFFSLNIRSLTVVGHEIGNMNKKIVRTYPAAESRLAAR